MILMTSLAAFIYTSADCVLNYMLQQQPHHRDEHSDVNTLPAFTVCNLNPLRSDVQTRKQRCIVPLRISDSTAADIYVT